MKKLLRIACLLLLCFPLLSPSALAVEQTKVPAGKVGIGNDTIIVAESGSVVYARKGSNVQYWPGSKLVPVSQAGNLPDCANYDVSVLNGDRELVVQDSASACSSGDTAVVALEGSIVIYDDNVPLIRRPVNRR